jgi:hypothetical protein
MGGLSKQVSSSFSTAGIKRKQGEKQEGEEKSTTSVCSVCRQSIIGWYGTTPEHDLLGLLVGTHSI